MLLEKLNMLIGTFFSEMGTALLTVFSDYDPHLEDIKQSLVVSPDWTQGTFQEASRKLKAYQYSVDIDRLSLPVLKQMLLAKRDFLVRLLENPILLEHETFTALLRAVFHLTEELAARKDLAALPRPDREHLANDVCRAYVLMVSEWLDYMHHLKSHYPYLFSLALRTNPFDEQASPLVTEPLGKNI